ncbi:MAG: response regulator [Aquificaceae bacterium]|nr:MAG: response regulator [Aquificaceae bacterium]
MSNSNSIGICFFGLPTKDMAVFDRVIEFIAKKGKKFHKCPAEFADIFLVNDSPESLELANKQRKLQLIISVSDSNDCTFGDYNIKRPLLITRVMRAFDESSKLCKTAKTETNKATNPVEETVTQNSQQTDKHYDFHALVVDDSAAIRKQLEIELRDTTISADYANCGKEALEKIENNKYDLIFLDIIMPDIDGYEVCKQLRQKKNYKKTPVIMLSGKTSPLDEVNGILAGASTYLLKPVQHADFQKTLTRISKWLNEFA